MDSASPARFVFCFCTRGLGSGDRGSRPGRDRLLYSHLGKLGALAVGVFDQLSPTWAASSGGDGTAAKLKAGTAGLHRVVDGSVRTSASRGGDPDTIVIVANSRSRDETTAAYLFNKDWRTESSPRVAAAILASGRFGSLAPEIEED